MTKERYEEIFANCLEKEQFVRWLNGRELKDLRLPLNNPEALEYLELVNYHRCEYNGYWLSWSVNMYTWAAPKKIPMKPQTLGEYLDNLSTKEDSWDASRIFIGCDKQYLDIEYMLVSGVAAAFVEFGTWEDNPEPEKYITYDEYFNNN